MPWHQIGTRPPASCSFGYKLGVKRFGNKLCSREVGRSPTWFLCYWRVRPFATIALHDDVIKWKHFPRYWPFVRGIHRSPVNSPHKSQWHGALMSSLIYIWINGWVNNREAGDLRRYRAHYDVTAMSMDKKTLLIIALCELDDKSTKVDMSIYVCLQRWNPRSLYTICWMDI